jgi:hypothetical protein
MKNKINIRKKMIRRSQNDHSEYLKSCIKAFNKSIKKFYHGMKLRKVRKIIVPGSSGSL